MWAARPMAMARHWDRTVLVLEDPGGVALGHPLDLASSLRLAIGLSTAVGSAHEPLHVGFAMITTVPSTRPGGGLVMI